MVLADFPVLKEDSWCLFVKEEEESKQSTICFCQICPTSAQAAIKNLHGMEIRGCKIAESMAE